MCRDQKEQQQYRQILIHHAIPSGKKLIGNGFVFAHDNDPKHTAISVRNYLDGKVQKGHIQVIRWPSQSPDLNPIENLWNIVKMKRKEFKATSAVHLFAKIQEIWFDLPTETLNKLVESMPTRIQAVIAVKGGHTKY